MQRQRSILSFFKNSSPPENKSSSAANTLDLNQSVQFSAKQTKPISSSLPELSSGSSAPPEISGTDTPPEKLPRQVLPSKFPENGESSRPSLFSSIMHKFAKVDDKSTSRERNQVEGGSSNGCSTSNESGISQRLSKHELPFHQKSSIYAVESRGRGEGFLSKLESDLDILGPETPATRRSFSRFKRVQEDSVGNDSNNINTKLMNSSKRLKIAQNSPPENKKCMDTSESSSSKFVWLNPSSIRDANRRRPGDPLYDKRTLYIPPEDLKKMSASQKQYWNVKKQYMDVVLFFKVGKFYELYELDAEIGHKELDWKMTFSGVGKCRQVGISESGIDEAVQKLISRGYKVGRMEQTETSDQAKARGGATSVIQRKLVHVVTPSTITDGNIGPDAVHLLTLKELLKVSRSINASARTGASFARRLILYTYHNILVLFYAWNEGCEGSRSENGSTIYGFAFVDCAALKFWVGSISDDASCLALGALLMQVSPKEVIFESRGLCKEAQKALKKYSSPGHTSLQSSAALSVTDFVDASEVRELVQSRGYFKGSFNSWDHGFDGDVHHDVAICALGGLCSHLSWLMLNDVLCNGEILPYLVYRGCLRLDGQSLVNLEIFSNSADGGTSGTLYKYLDNCLTLSGKRLLRSWICHPLKDVVEINNRLNAVEELITHPEATYVVAQYLRRLPDIERLLGRVKASVGSSATLLLPLVGEKVLKQRVKTFGSLVKGMRIGLDLLLLLQEKENELLSLSKVLDVPQLSGSSGLDKLLSQFESAVDSDFPNYSNHVVSSSDGETLSALIELFVESDTQWSHIVHALNCIDVLLSFAATTSSSCRTMCRPTLLPANSICQEGCGRAVLQIKGLWHPCAALGANEDTIVPNDIYLGEDSTGLCPGTLLLTGPNMGGKSTLLRATCLAVILAQLGCYVPCEMCVLTPVDTIFTRLGATDRIMTGESTFLIECTETASVLQSATQDSLVLLDELGRGTSTFDGYAIAYAVFHHLVEKVKCRLLFATHYHSLTKEFASHPNVKLQHMACTFRPKPGSTFTGDQELVFLYRLASGACPESYGLQVALMAGISKKVVEVAAKASQKMKHSLQKNFSTSEQRSEFSTLHEYWLKALLSLTKGRECSLDEDACDTFLCLYHELKSSYQMAKLIK